MLHQANTQTCSVHVLTSSLCVPFHTASKTVPHSSSRQQRARITQVLKYSMPPKHSSKWHVAGLTGPKQHSERTKHRNKSRDETIITVSPSSDCDQWLLYGTQCLKGLINICLFYSSSVYLLFTPCHGIPIPVTPHSPTNTPKRIPSFLLHKQFCFRLMRRCIL